MTHNSNRHAGENARERRVLLAKRRELLQRLSKTDNKRSKSLLLYALQSMYS